MLYSRIKAACMETEICRVFLVTNRAPEIGFSGTLNQPKNGVLNEEFSSFFAKFLAYFIILSNFAVSTFGGAPH